MPTYEPDELLRRGVITAGYGWTNVEQRITDHLLVQYDRVPVAKALAKAMVELAKPGRVGRLDELVAALSEAMFDDAHEGCGADEEGCTGGGRPHYDEYAQHVLRPALEEYAVAEPGPEVCGLAECRTALPGGCCHDLLDAEETPA